MLEQSYLLLGAFHMKLDLQLAFPIKDAASADLMKLKAACLLRAGVLEEWEARKIIARADRLIVSCSAASNKAA
jgi:hypothetical protein